ncbi:MAG: copper chaperone PCu(A)C [Pseudomonadota bacterium]
MGHRFAHLVLVSSILLSNAANLLAAATEKVQIGSAWARASTGPVGVIYANFHNTQNQDRSLVEVRVGKQVCDHAELHTHSHEGNIVKMRPVDKIALKAGQTTRLEQGGLHIMLMGLKRPLSEGETLPVTFVFDQGDPLKVGVPVQRLASFDNTGDNTTYGCPYHQQ